MPIHSHLCFQSIGYGVCFAALNTNESTMGRSITIYPTIQNVSFNYQSHAVRAQSNTAKSKYDPWFRKRMTHWEDVILDFLSLAIFCYDQIRFVWI